MADLCTLDAWQIAEGVRSGDLRALDVVDSCLERTLAVDPAIGAYLEVFADRSRERAEEIDERRRRGGPVGALAGVPVAVKDNLNIAGCACTCGSAILDGYQATFSATPVERLLDADAVLLGRTNLDEFGMGSSCENSALQTTRNPWDPQRVPGGSSGGSAAAVAYGSVPLALGTDTGGSIRQPAALCGVTGLKPTYGRVSRWGLVAFASSLDQVGPLARSARDAALALEAIAGRDPRDATSSDRPVDAYAADLAAALSGVRVGTIAEIDMEGLGDEVRDHWRQSLEHLRGLGAEIVEVSVPNLPAAIAVYYVVANCEASANLARFDGARYGHRADTETLLDMYCKSRTQGFGSEVKRRILLGTFALSSGYYDAYYGRARGVQAALQEQLSGSLRQVDVLVTPTSPTTAFQLGERVADPLAMYLCDVFTTPASLAGIPAVAVPTGLDRQGLPLSLQIMGGAFDESLILRIAHQLGERCGRLPLAPLPSSPPGVS